MIKVRSWLVLIIVVAGFLVGAFGAWGMDELNTPFSHPHPQVVQSGSTR